MAFDNTVTVVGNVTRDVDLRFSPQGMPVAYFGVAWNKRNKNGDDETSFFDVTCFGSLAENVAESIGKGTRVVVFGALQQRSWQTKDGDRRTKVGIVAEDVGPSLRWATVEVTRNERDDQFRSTNNRGNTAPPAYGPDEEPF